MKSALLIVDSPVNRISYYHLAFFVASLPFDRLFSELALISLCIHTIVHFQPVKLGVKRMLGLLFPAALYLLTCLGTLYSPDPAQAFFEWEIQLALLLFPLIFLVNRLNLEKYAENLLVVLGFSCVLVTGYLFFYACKVIIYNHLPFSAIFSDAFLNQQFSQPLDLHATYFSMYIVISIPVFIRLLILPAKKNQRLLYVICITVLLAGLFQLSAKTVWAALFLIVIFAIPLLFLSRQQRFVFLLLSVLFFLFCIIFVASNEDFRQRYFSTLVGDLTQPAVMDGTVEPRIIRWKAAIGVIESAPFFGHGSGSELLYMKEAYYQHKYYSAYVNELNIHNQYLSILIKTGFAGLFVYLLILCKGFFLSLKQRNAYFLSFMILVTVVGFGENILDVNKGIFFFSFFYSLFYAAYLSETKVQSITV